MQDFQDLYGRCNCSKGGNLSHSGRGESSKRHVISHRFNRSHRIPRAFIPSYNLRIGMALRFFRAGGKAPGGWWVGKTTGINQVGLV